MRKAFVFAATGGLLGASVTPVAAQRLAPPAKVDSTFRANFLSLGEKLRQQQPLTRSESGFAYVIGFLSGHDFFPPVDYSGVPHLTSQGLLAAKKWYRVNRYRIEWPRLQRGLLLLNGPLTDEAATELEALKIK